MSDTYIAVILSSKDYFYVAFFSSKSENGD